MKTLIRLEELSLVALAVFLFAGLPFAWWWYPLLLLVPDLSMLGYLADSRTGAYLYNLVHHKGVAVGLFVIGSWLSVPLLQLIGLVLLGHSSLDRVFGYGLKHRDAFQHTHLGWIGRAGPAAGSADSVKP